MAAVAAVGLAAAEAYRVRRSVAALARSAVAPRSIAVHLSVAPAYRLAAALDR